MATRSTSLQNLLKTFRFEMDSNCISQIPETSSTVIPTQKLRSKIREYTKFHRDQLRASASDALRFGIGEIKAKIDELDNLSEKDVLGIAGRIKRRKHATNEDMYRLSHAFLQSMQNIEAFSKIPGAIQVLVKELTGNESGRQLFAAECLCNLSLGDSPVCEKIASMAGSYLVTYLHSNETELVRLSLWTLANILATGQKGASILLQMEIIAQLWKLYCDDNVSDPMIDFRHDAGLCLQLLALQCEELLNAEHRKYLLDHVTEKNPTCPAGEYHMQIVFHLLFPYKELLQNELTESKQLYLINYSLNNIYHCNQSNLCALELVKLQYSIRILGNILLLSFPSTTCYNMLLQQISSVWQSNLVALLNKLFAYQNENLITEALWLLKNILQLEEQSGRLPLNLLDNLHIRKDSIAAIENLNISEIIA